MTFESDQIQQIECNIAITGFLGERAYVEASTGIEPVYTDLQSDHIIENIE